ncbi:PP2A regulatory subunit TAP46 [Diplonema papillatum]|nr:PP2A regulatory subunit TAP46 [Diplonema papillatum]
MSTLNEAFSEAMKAYAAMEQWEGGSADKEKQELVKKCVEMFTELVRGVDSAKVFSANEEIDDVSTKDVKFFVVHYYLGDLYERIVDTNRVRNLRNASMWFQFFMRNCLNYGLISEKEYESLLTPLNPTDRAARIERLKKQKELQASLAALAEKKKQLSRSIGEEGAESGKLEKEEEEEDNEFDAVERKYWLLTVEDKLRSASQQLHMSTREVEMLSSLTQEQKDEAAKSYQEAIADAKGRKPDPRSMTRIESTPEPVLITELSMDRQKLMQEVYMNRNPATMSDAEYAQQAMDRMVSQNDEKPEDDNSEDDEIHERKQAKASKWADWKDDHAQDGNMGANIG